MGVRNYIGVLLGSKHSWRDYQLKPVKFWTPLPKQRRIEREVPGKQGKLDLSEALTGCVMYENRELQLVFDLRAKSQEEFDQNISVIRNELDGRNMEIILDSDQVFYYCGRIALTGEYDPENIDHEITIIVNAEPYKLKRNVTEVVNTIVDQAQIICPNLRKEVVPTITTDADFQIEFEGETYSISAGENIIPEILFRAGDNILTCTGSGTITFTYQEGSL